MTSQRKHDLKIIMFRLDLIDIVKHSLPLVVIVAMYTDLVSNYVALMGGQ